MKEVLKALAKQPYWVISLVLGVGLVASACVTIDKDSHWTSHPPTTFWLIGVGVAMLVLSWIAFGLTLYYEHAKSNDVGAGLNLSTVRESDGTLSTKVSACEIRVTFGRIEDHVPGPNGAIVLPCNEYFDRRCFTDPASALGAYVNRTFEHQIEELVALVGEECRLKLGNGTEQQKTTQERALSFGAGRCVLILKPLGHRVPVALLSTTTQRATQGLAGRISYLFDGMTELVARLADARLAEITMPILGAGKGGIYEPLALVGLLSALAEAARYGQGGQRLKQATIVVYKRDVATPGLVDPVVVRRALALIGTSE